MIISIFVKWLVLRCRWPVSGALGGGRDRLARGGARLPMSKPVAEGGVPRHKEAGFAVLQPGYSDTA